MNDGRGAVGAVVVDDEHLPCDAAAHERGANAGQQPAKAVGLPQGRDDERKRWLRFGVAHIFQGPLLISFKHATIVKNCNAFRKNATADCADRFNFYITNDFFVCYFRLRIFVTRFGRRKAAGLARDRGAPMRGCNKKQFAATKAYLRA